jgi:hypothetical protein
MIDAHHHLWDLAAREHRWLMDSQAWASDDELARLRRSFTLADLVPVAAAAGVTGTVVIQTAAEPWETPDLLALAVGRDPYTTKDQSPRSPAAKGSTCWFPRSPTDTCPTAPPSSPASSTSTPTPAPAPRP